MAVATARETILLLLVTLVSSAAVIDARPSRQRSSTLDWGGNSRGGLAMPSIPTDAHYSATSWAGPDSEPGIAISNSGGVDDPSARYEVYVPDGTGQMAHQLLTLTEIRSLLARQSLGDDHSAGTVDADAAQLYHHYAANSGTGSDALVASRASDAHDVHLISQLGKAASESSSSPAEGVIDSIPVSQLVASASADGAASTVVPNSNSSSSSAVSDVISSVMTIMATQMAQRDQLNDSKSSPVVVVMATDDHAASSSTTVVVPTTDNHSSQQPQTTTTSTTVVTESTTTVQMTSDQPKTTTSAESEGRTERVPVAAEAKEEDHHHHHDEHHHHGDEHGHHHHHGASSSATFDPLPEDNIGLRATSGGQERELNDLTMRSNRLAWRVWNEAVLQSTDGGVEANRIISPLALTTALGISFLGAGGSTAEAIDKALGLDSLTYRNPHLHLHQVANDVATLSSKSDQHFSSTQSHIVYLASASSSSSPTRGGSSSNGIKVRDIFRARLDTLYGASIVGNTSELSRLSASSTPATAADSPLWKNVQSAPFAIVSSAALNVAWPNSVKLTTPTGNEEEEDYLQFLNLPSSAQVVQGRRLVKVPTIRTTGAFYAGYDEKLDATTVALPLHPVRNADGEEEAAGNDGGASSADFFGPTSDALDQAGQLSLVLVMPGTAAKFDAGGTGLSALEKKLAAASASENGGGDAWERLLSQTKLHDHLVVELPQLSLHTESSLVGAMRAGAGGQLADVLFESAKADFGAMATSPSKQVPLYLADIIQLTSLNISSVATIGDDHHHHHHSDHEDNEAPVGRSEDGNRKKQQQQQKKNVVKPNKVQSTVKSPCEIFMEKYQNEKKEKENVTSTTEKPFTTTTKVQVSSKTTPKTTTKKPTTNNKTTPKQQKQSTAATTPKSPSLSIVTLTTTRKPIDNKNNSKTTTMKPSSKVTSTTRRPASGSSKKPTAAVKATTSARPKTTTTTVPSVSANISVETLPAPEALIAVVAQPSTTTTNKPSSSASSTRLTSKVTTTRPKTTTKKSSGAASSSVGSKITTTTRKPVVTTTTRRTTPSSPKVTSRTTTQKPVKTMTKKPSSPKVTPAPAASVAVVAQSTISSSQIKSQTGKTTTTTRRPLTASVATASKKTGSTPAASTSKSTSTQRPTTTVKPKATTPTKRRPPPATSAPVLKCQCPMYEDQQLASANKTKSNVNKPTAPSNSKASAVTSKPKDNKQKQTPTTTTTKRPTTKTMTTAKQPTTKTTTVKPKINNNNKNNNKTSTDTSSGSRMRREAAGEEEMEDEEEETEQAIAPRLEEGEEEEHNHHHHDNHHHHHHQGEGHKQKVSFNRAFLYAVRHNPTGLLLMIGRYVHPDHHDIIGGHDEHDHHAHHGEEHHHEHHEHH